MSDHIALIWKKLSHLARMREYLCYSNAQVEALLPINDWQALQPDQHETLAAFRVRFSEFQEHMGKTMKAVAVEDDPAVLHEFFTQMIQTVPELLHWHDQLIGFCKATYPKIA